MLVRHLPATEHLGSEQWVHRFGNGFGASVVRGQFTFGGSEGLYELAVIRWWGVEDEDWRLDYGTPITQDVLGYLTEDEVTELLARIEALPSPPVGVDGVSRE